MKGPRETLAWIGVGLAATLTGCITHDQPPPAPRVAHPASNGLTDEQLQWYLQQGSQELQGCWAETPMSESKYALLEISISKEGTVTAVHVPVTNLDSPDSRRCLEDHIRRIRFPPRDAPTKSTFKVRFVGADAGTGG